MTQKACGPDATHGGVPGDGRLGIVAEGTIDIDGHACTRSRGGEGQTGGRGGEGETGGRGGEMETGGRG
eukprot:4686126-Prymnesium_polylepis.1